MLALLINAPSSTLESRGCSVLSTATPSLLEPRWDEVLLLTAALCTWLLPSAVSTHLTPLPPTAAAPRAVSELGGSKGSVPGGAIAPRSRGG